VKPLPIISDQRQLLFGMYFARQFMHSWRNWQSVRLNLHADVKFMDTALTNPLVDYSLLVSAFYVNDPRLVLDYIKLPNCVEKLLSELGYTDGEEETQGSILICFTVIDMLMEFTRAKVPENTILFGKWSNWGQKVMTMFDCLGQHTLSGCGKYNSYLPKYDGADLQLPLARYQDVTSYLSGDGRVSVQIGGATKLSHSLQIEKKCCCIAGWNGEMGYCSLFGILDNNNTFMFTSSTGCGHIAGKGYHSYWRDAKRCMINRVQARDLREKAMMPLS